VGSIPITRSISHGMKEENVFITVNGDIRGFPPGATVAQLLAELDTVGKRVAVERNGEIVPKSQHGSTELNSGDQLEIVIAVGGG
jgi:sulfur carrier protein